MAKKVVAVIKLALQAGKANPAPPVGPALGQHGVNIMAFCKEYNARTQEKAGYVIPVEISVFEDRSFTFITKTPPAAVLISKAAGIEKGAATSSKGSVGAISRAQLEEIAKTKLPDLNCTSVESAMRIIAGTARNMGVVVNDLSPTQHLLLPTYRGRPKVARTPCHHAQTLQAFCRPHRQG